jgi:hypothetical protein
MEGNSRARYSIRVLLKVRRVRCSLPINSMLGNQAAIPQGAQETFCGAPKRRPSPARRMCPSCNQEISIACRTCKHCSYKLHPGKPGDIKVIARKRCPACGERVSIATRRCPCSHEFHREKVSKLATNTLHHADSMLGNQATIARQMKQLGDSIPAQPPTFWRRAGGSASRTPTALSSQGIVEVRVMDSKKSALLDTSLLSLNYKRQACSPSTTRDKLALPQLQETSLLSLNPGRSGRKTNKRTAAGLEAQVCTPKDGARAELQQHQQQEARAAPKSASFRRKGHIHGLRPCGRRLCNDAIRKPIRKCWKHRCGGGERERV